ncbi:MAG: hypothetical protein RJA59_644 [Pseudomonadota bacterium]
MAKAKKKMGDLSALVGQGKRQATGAQALAAITGGRAVPVTSEASEMTVTTVRLRREQWTKLRDAATARADGKAGGQYARRKPDASEIVREALDAWFRANK